MDSENEAFMQVEALSVKTPMGSVYEDVSFKAERGQVVCVYGDQGSGKTALLLTVTGRMKPNSGSAVVAGHDLGKHHAKIRDDSNISFIPGLNDVQPFLKVRDIAAAELALVGKRANRVAVNEFLEHWDFKEFADVRFKDLESYECIRFGIILACTGDPEVLAVDDVQTDVTQHQSIKLVNMLKEIAIRRNILVLFGCSEYEIARQADGIVVMSEGAELQRRAVLRDNGSDAGVAVFGSGNEVSTDIDQPAGPYKRGGVR